MPIDTKDLNENNFGQFAKENMFGSGKSQSPLEFLGSGVSKLWHGVTGLPTSKEKRDQARMIKEQVDAYKRLTEITEKELESKKAEKAEEKRRVNEKQIRGLRNRYRPSGGLLNQSQPGSGQLTNTGNEGQSTALGV